MPNIWRRQPSRRLSSFNLVKKEASSQSVSIANEFFEVPSLFYGILKRWTGSAWVKALLKVYLGSWLAKPLKRWNGTQWVLVDVSG